MLKKFALTIIITIVVAIAYINIVSKSNQNADIPVAKKVESISSTKNSEKTVEKIILYYYKFNSETFNLEKKIPFSFEKETFEKHTTVIVNEMFKKVKTANKVLQFNKIIVDKKSKTLSADINGKSALGYSSSNESIICDEITETLLNLPDVSIVKLTMDNGEPFIAETEMDSIITKTK